MADGDVKKEQPLPPKDFADEAFVGGSEPPSSTKIPTPSRLVEGNERMRTEGSRGGIYFNDLIVQETQYLLPLRVLMLNAKMERSRFAPAHPLRRGERHPKTPLSSIYLCLKASLRKSCLNPQKTFSVRISHRGLLPEQLLEKARQFLHSPEIRWQDTEKKREFLTAKGLDRRDIKMLLEEVSPPPPPLPPRSYPGAKESRMMHLLKWFAKFTKVCAYVAGISAATVFVYWWFMLPRISSSLAARGELQAQRLAQSEKLKEQVDEVAHSREICGGDEITVVDDSAESSGGEGRTNHPTDESFKDLTRALSDLRTSLTTLRFARQVDKSRQETLDSINNLTGYVSARVYSVPGYSANGGIVKKPPVLGPIEDEVKSEIRALKGLVLNRRSFVAASLRQSSQPPVPVA